jgi:hypothetical protein
VRFGIAATSKVSRSRLMRVTLGMAALVREHNCGTQTTVHTFIGWRGTGGGERRHRPCANRPSQLIESITGYAGTLPRVFLKAT